MSINITVGQQLPTVVMREEEKDSIVITIGSQETEDETLELIPEQEPVQDIPNSEPEKQDPITITVGDQNSSEIPQEPSKSEPQDTEKPISFNLKARRTLDGNVMISDHPDIDIVMMPKKMKILALVKDSMDDSVYDTQDRLFKHLYKYGIISQESIRGGNVYASIEAKILPSETKVPIDQLALIAIAKFIEKEKPSYVYEKEIEDQRIDDLTNPSDANSTELFKVPHDDTKGSISPTGQNRRYAYGI